MNRLRQKVPAPALQHWLSGADPDPYYRISLDPGQ